MMIWFSFCAHELRRRRSSAVLPDSTKFEFKFVKKRADNYCQWEPIDGNRGAVVGGIEATLVCGHFGALSTPTLNIVRGRPSPPTAAPAPPPSTPTLLVPPTSTPAQPVSPRSLNRCRPRRLVVSKTTQRNNSNASRRRRSASGASRRTCTLACRHTHRTACVCAPRPWRCPHTKFEKKNKKKTALFSIFSRCSRAQLAE